MSLAAAVLACAFAAALTACATVCPKTWETKAGVEHSKLFGPGYSSEVSIGGAIGKECEE